MKKELPERIIQRFKSIFCGSLFTDPSIRLSTFIQDPFAVNIFSYGLSFVLTIKETPSS